MAARAFRMLFGVQIMDSPYPILPLQRDRRRFHQSAFVHAAHLKPDIVHFRPLSL